LQFRWRHEQDTVGISKGGQVRESKEFRLISRATVWG
jgi:hypothetical protein